MDADKVAEQLLADKVSTSDSLSHSNFADFEIYDSILRYGADNAAVKKLLYFAVFDTSDDVRRAVVTSFAFLLFRNPGQVPRLVQLLSESYNAHVQCGATLALGLSCAGTGSSEAIALLEPMAKDPVDFVRQGALIALAMILIQQTEASSPSLAPTRASFAKIIANKHEDPVASSTPAFDFYSNAKPSLFVYPAPTKPPTKRTIQQVETTVFSTTAKARARERVKEKAKAAEAGEAMETDAKNTEAKPKDDDTSMKVDETDPNAKPAEEGAPAASKP
ncbi:proteasome regulatory particle base subunit [Tulasnella sp. 427]|nr:proteasome regulatory particle base subunit [Tulasnella sp. 427]